MTTCTTIIERAYRKARLRGPTEAPTAAEAAAGLETLQAYYLELVADGAFGRLTEVIVTDDYEAGENERIYNTSGGAVTITLPETVVDDLTGEDRPPRDRSLVVVSGSPQAAHIYSAALGAWQEITSLTQNSTAPLAELSVDGLASAVAVRLSNENGKDPGQFILASAQAFRSRVGMRANAPRLETEANYF